MKEMAIEIGFCDDEGRGFGLVQPAQHVERWSLPHDNGSHLVVHWRPTKWVCGLNVTAYHIDVKTSSPLLNRFVALFGKMPQDVCAADSVVGCTLLGEQQCGRAVPCAAAMLGLSEEVVAPEAWAGRPSLRPLEDGSWRSCWPTTT